MTPWKNRLVRCEVGQLTSGGRFRPLDEHLGVLMSAGTPPRWLHAADVVGLPGGEGLCPAEVLDRLPGCRVTVGLAETSAVHVRGGSGPVRVSDAGSAGVVAALACSRPLAGEPPPVGQPADGLAAEFRGAELSVRSYTEATPSVTVSARLRGRTVLCRWTALR